VVHLLDHNSLLIGISQNDKPLKSMTSKETLTAMDGGCVLDAQHSAAL
jgi:hypothetical protein